MAGVGQKFSLLDLERVCETAVGPGSMLGSATSEL